MGLVGIAAQVTEGPTVKHRSAREKTIYEVLPWPAYPLPCPWDEVEYTINLKTTYKRYTVERQQNSNRHSSPEAFLGDRITEVKLLEPPLLGETHHCGCPPPPLAAWWLFQELAFSGVSVARWQSGGGAEWCGWRLCGRWTSEVSGEPAKPWSADGLAG